MKYNFIMWWLSTKIKPMPYKIWRYIAFPVIFIIWVGALSAFSEYYWKISLYIILPAVIIDLVWDSLNYIFYYKKKQLKIDNLDKGE